MKVKDRAESIGTFRYVNVFLMETLAKWVPSTPEMEAKILFGRHIWLVAQAADRLGRRARELRAPLHYSRPPKPRFAEGLAALAALRPTAARIEAMYATALPSIADAYSQYLSRTDAIIDEPSLVILQDLLRDVERMRSESARLLDELPTLRGTDPAAMRELKGHFAAPAEMTEALSP